MSLSAKSQSHTLPTASVTSASDPLDTDTRGGPYRDGDWGGSACKRNAVYLFLADRVGERLTLPALGAEIRSAGRLDGGPLEWKADKTSLRLRLADRAQDPRPIFVCVKLELDRPAFPLPLVDGQPILDFQPVRA